MALVAILSEDRPYSGFKELELFRGGGFVGRGEQGDAQKKDAAENLGSSTQVPIFYRRSQGCLCPHCRLGNDVMDDMAVDVSKAVLATLELEGETFVVNAEEVENGGLKIVDMNLVSGHLEPEFIAGPMGVTGL